MTASLQFSKAIQSLELLSTDISVQSCCSSKTDVCSLDEESEYADESSDACCTTSNCDCSCCSHIVFYYNFSDWSTFTEDLDREVAQQKSYYLSDYSYSLFHPPIS